jgi:hypothetical protein
VQKIFADSMSPAHVTPLVTEGVVLKKEVVFAVEEDETVGIIGPVFAGREVHLRTEGLIVVRSLSARDREGGGEQKKQTEKA